MNDFMLTIKFLKKCFDILLIELLAAIVGRILVSLGYF